MRLFFYLLILVVAIVYTQSAFVDHTFMTHRGRMGPGFFPRILGVSIIVIMLLVILIDAKKGTLFSGPQQSQYKDAAVLIGLALSFGVLLMLFGYVVAIPAFIGSALFYFNRGQYLINIIVIIAVPVIIHFLFGSVLNAALPRGMWW